MFTIEVTAQRGVTAAVLGKAIDAELERVRRDGVTTQELEGARTTLRTEAVARLERLGGVAETLNRYHQFRGDPGYLAADLARYDAVSGADLARLAREQLADTARVVVTGLPGERILTDVPRRADRDDAVAATGGTMADAPFRATPPEPGPSPSVALPVPARFTLDNGLTVIVAEQHALPIVNATLVVGAGTATNPVARPGLASLTAALLEEGTTRRTADDVADGAALLGTTLTAHGGRDSAQISVEVLASRAGAGLELLADVVRRPRLAEADLGRVRRLRDDELRQAATDPGTASRHVLLRALYGTGHPYGYPDAGTRDALGRVSVADVRRLWSERYTPGTSALVLTGDLSVESARALAVTYFGDWRASPSAAAMPPPVRAPGRPAFYLIDRPGAPQSAVTIGGLGPRRATTDYVPLEITNNVLGGLFSSRLNLDLRERHGYTYGAASSFRYAAGAGYFSVETLVRTDATAAALSAALGDIDDLYRVPPSAGELALARGAFAESLAGLFETASSTSQALTDLYVYGLPPDYYATLAGAAAGVTVADVTRMAERHLRLADRTVVVAGDRRRIAAGLARLGLGAPILVDDDGAPVHRRRRH